MFFCNVRCGTGWHSSIILQRAAGQDFPKSLKVLWPLFEILPQRKGGTWIHSYSKENDPAHKIVSLDAEFTDDAKRIAFEM